MSPQYAIAMFGLSAGVFGAVALVWALWRRQLRTGDAEMYRAVADDEPDFASSAPRARGQRGGLWLLALALAAVVGAVIWLQVQTVIAASHAAGLPQAVKMRSHTGD